MYNDMDVIRKRTKFRRLANHYASTFTSSEPMIYIARTRSKLTKIKSHTSDKQGSFCI